MSPLDTSPTIWSIVPARMRGDVDCGAVGEETGSGNKEKVTRNI
jgi:hypothetical protein